MLIPVLEEQAQFRARSSEVRPTRLSAIKPAYSRRKQINQFPPSFRGTFNINGHASFK